MRNIPLFHVYIRDSFTLILESYALIREIYAFIRESYALIRKKYNFSPTKTSFRSFSHNLYRYLRYAIPNYITISFKP